MATAPVIDFETLLAPVPGDDPAGSDLSVTPLFAELNELRRSEDDNLGDWASRDAKTANWPKLIKIATENLVNKSKDLRIVGHLTEALVQVYGLAGLRDGLHLTREIQERYWDGVYPRIVAGEDDDENPIEIRAAAIGRLDRLIYMPVRFVRATKSASGSAPLTHADWDFANHLENLKSKGDKASTDAFQEAVDQGKPTLEIFRTGVSATPRSFYENFVADLDAAGEELARLNALHEEWYRDAEQVPYLSETGKSLESVNQMVSEIEGITGPLRETPQEETTAEEVSETGEPVLVRAAAAGGGGFSEFPVDRDDALRRLQVVASYFRKAEPHSPVTYLVERAISWAGMPLDRWLAEVIKDEGSLSHIRETLGVKPPE